MRKSLKLSIFVIGIFSLLGFFSISQNVYADGAPILTPGGSFSDCGIIEAAGTYELTADIGAAGITCLEIKSSGVIIDSASSYKIFGNIVATGLSGDADGFSFIVSGSVGLVGDVDMSGSGTGSAGTVTLNGGNSNNEGVITGNAVFNDAWNENWNGGAGAIVNGNAVFNGGGGNAGTVNGNVVFNDTAHFYNDGTQYGGAINGNVVFNDSSYVYNYDSGGGAYVNIIGNADFYDSSYIMVGSGYYLTGGATTFHYTSFDLSSTCVLKQDFQTQSVVFASSSPVFNFNSSGCGSNWDFSPTTWDFGTSTPTFNFYGTTEMSATLTANVNFWDTSFNNLGEITGDVVFNNTSYNSGTITGSATFNDQSYNNNSSISGLVVFNEDSINYSNTAGGNEVIFNDNSINEIGAITGSTTFNGNARNVGDVSGNAIFNDTSFNGGGTISGNATFTADSYSYNDSSGFIYPQNGNVNSTTYFIPASGTTTVMFNVGDPGIDDSCGGNRCVWDESDSYVFGDGNGSVTAVWNFYGNSYNSATLSVPSNGNVNFYDNSSNESYTIYGNVVFNGTDGNNGAIVGDVIFNNSSYNYSSGTIDGNATFHDSSFNGGGTISGNATFTADSYSYNSISGYVSPNNNGGSIAGTIYFIPASGTTTVTFNVGESGVDNACGGNPCYWNDTYQYTFGDGNGSVSPIWNFYGNSYNGGTINVPANGEVNFYGNSYNDGSVSIPLGGAVNFYDYAHNGATNAFIYNTDGGALIFNDDSYNGYNEAGDAIIGSVIFNDRSYNTGTINGSATFTADSYSYNSNSGSVSPNTNWISGDIYFIPASGTSTVTFNVGVQGQENACGGNACFWSDTYQYIFGDGNGSVSPIWNFYGNSSNSGDIYVPINGQINFYDSSLNGMSGSGFINNEWGGTVTFNDYSFNYYAVDSGTASIVGGTVIFNDYSYNNNATIGNNAVFNDSSYNTGTIGGNATFNDSSYNYNNISGTATFTADSYSYNSNSGSVSPNAAGSVGGIIYFIPASGTTTVTFNIGNPGESNDCSGSQCAWSDVYQYTFGDGNGSVTPIWNFYGNSYNGGTIYVPSYGRANFYDESSNSSGTIDGNADVYYPNPNKWLGGSITGITRYHGYPALYFNDSVDLGGAGDGDWSNMLNWWTDEQFTNPAGSVPDQSNDVFVYANIPNDNIGGAAAKSVTFAGSAVNGISISVTDGATFTASSTNNGNIQGDVAFEGEDPSAGSGSITGLLTRLFSSNASTTHDYTTDGGRNDWIIIARNAVVDLTSATYSRLTNIFKALGNGLFITNPSIDSGASVVPEINIAFPTTGTITKWTGTEIDWDTSATCEYKMDGSSSYTSLNCANNGSDIPRPTAGAHVMFVKGTDSLGNISEKSVAFTYDNTVPTYTSCGTDLLDESTRPYYYLTSDVYGNCNVMVNNVEIRGSLTATSTIGYTIHGNVLASALATGDNGFNITLKYVGVTGYVTTVGAPGASGIDGGNGGNITIATSTTGAVYANGGNTSANSTNGGNGGNITITYSLGNASSTVVSSTGGNSTVCGNGGNGGTVTITDSGNYATPTVTGGTGHSCGGGGGGSSGQSGSGTVAGNPPGYTAPSAPAAPSTPTPTRTVSGGTTNPVYNPLLNNFTIPVAKVTPLTLPALPTFGGEGKGSFSFENLFGNFLFAPLPPALTNKLTKAQLAYLASAGVSTQQDLLLLRNKVIPLPVKDVPPGIITLTSDGSNVPMSATYDPKKYLIEKATVNSLSTITIYFTPTTPNDNIIATIGTSTIRTLKKVAGSSAYSASFTAPEIGTYNMSVTGAPFDLKLDVIKAKPPVNAVEKVKQQSVWSVMKFWK